MDAEARRDWLRHFDALPDPRHHNIHHPLSDLIAIALLAVICGAENWAEVAQWGRAKEQWLRTVLSLPHGIASHDPFGRLFARLDPAAFERCLVAWAASIAESSAGQLVAIDGKTIRRSFDHASNKSAIHMINAWYSEHHLVLGQLATEAKDNEITAIGKLLELLDIDGATVSIDAIGCQKKIARQIDDQGADYVLQVKANQGGWPGN